MTQDTKAEYAEGAFVVTIILRYDIAAKEA